MINVLKKPDFNKKFISSTIFFFFIMGIYQNSILNTAYSQEKPTGDARSIELNEQGVKKIKENNLQAAEELFRKSLAIDQGNNTAAYNLAGVYLQEKKSKEAIQILKKYLNINPNNTNFTVRLGDAFFASKNIKDALLLYEKAYTTSPGHIGLAAKLATIYTLMNKMKKSLEMSIVAVKQDPKNGQLLANLAALFLANGSPQEAISTAKRALQVNPSQSVYVTLGSAYEALKDKSNALIAFQRAKDLGNKSKELDDKIVSLAEKK